MVSYKNAPCNLTSKKKTYPDTKISQGFLSRSFLIWQKFPTTKIQFTLRSIYLRLIYRATNSSATNLPSTNFLLSVLLEKITDLLLNGIKTLLVQINFVTIYPSCHPLSQKINISIVMKNKALKLNHFKIYSEIIQQINDLLKNTNYQKNILFNHFKTTFNTGNTLLDIVLVFLKNYLMTFLLLNYHSNTQKQFICYLVGKLKD